MAAFFKTKPVEDLLLKNFKTYCSLTNIPQNEDLNIREKIQKVLTDTEYSSRRPNKLDLDDFLKLLSEFNKAGLHFA